MQVCMQVCTSKPRSHAVYENESVPNILISHLRGPNETAETFRREDEVEACRCKWSAGKMAEVQCRSLLVTERRTVRTIATPRHSPFISRHRQMKNHCESATSVCINITKPQRRQSQREREREKDWERGPTVNVLPSLSRVQPVSPFYKIYTLFFGNYYLFFHSEHIS